MLSISDETKKLISKQVALNIDIVTPCLRMTDYSLMRMFNLKKQQLTAPINAFRRANDILAATFVHYLAIDQQNGDDCIDVNGNAMEVKLAFLKSDDLTISKQGNVIRKGSENGLIHNTQAKFRVHNGTAKGHHNKDTAFILVSEDHACFIGGFIMRGDKVDELLTSGSQKGVNRKISLSQFIKHGYEINSSVPHIGWERYHECLKNFVAGAEGMLPVPQAGEAHKAWTELADVNKLRKL